MTSAVVRSGCGLFTLAMCISCGGGTLPPERQDTDSLEAAYRANNQGVALLEQFAYESAAGAFRRALALDPTLRIAQVNLAIALFYAGEPQEAAAQAAAARRADPNAPQPIYLLGLIARAENRPDEAVEAFRAVLELDHDDVGTRVNLALAYVQQGRYEEAAASAESALALEPYNVTAAYNLGVALTRAGQREAGARAMQRFQELRTAPYAVTYSQTYFRQGRYAEAGVSSGGEPELVNSAPPAVVFADVTVSLVSDGAGQVAAGAGEMPIPLSGGVTLTDLDADGDLDVVSAGPAVRVLRNDRPRLVDVTRESGLTDIGPTTGAVAGDVDNDNGTDLLFLTMEGPRLFVRRDGSGFREASIPVLSGAAGQTARAAAFVDVDHDGDLDILIGGLTERPAPKTSGWNFLRSNRPAASRLIRNNGNGTFEDVTAASGLAGIATIVAVAPTDFDNRLDVDLLMVPYGARPRLFRNLRTGAFADVAPSVGLPGGGPYTSVALGDVNKDGFVDLFFGQESAPGLWALSDGAGRFRVHELPGSQAATATQILDYDNDGLLDLFLVTPGGPRMFRNLGRTWQEQTDRVFPVEGRSGFSAGNEVTAIASGDLDLDGDTDIVALMQTGALRFWRNDGGSANRSVRVTLRGRVSNRGGVGTKVELRAGSLYQRMETAAATPATFPSDLVFGLGRRGEADVVRLLWPSGILQAETTLPGDAPSAAARTIQELDRKPSSCPLLYTWNGQRFEFITDFMGGGETGSWLAPGVRNVPDPVEYVRITDQQLRDRDGTFEIRVTNELEEVLFVDQLKLLAVTHPADVSVFPDEGLRAAPRPFRLFATRQPHPPASATDGHGHDVLPQISYLDRRYPDDFDLLPIRGYAREHVIALDLAPGQNPPSAERTALLLTGWTDYALSSDNVAAHQAGLSLRPPALQVKDGDGRWQTVDDIGFPVGRPQTLVLDVTRFLSKSRQVRIVTNMRVYWDQILVATIAPVPLRVEPLERRAATLRWRGFSAPVTPDGREPSGYDYARILFASTWKLMPGRYTREGDVGELLAATDDRVVISQPGDELALSFDAAALPRLPNDARRTFLLFSDGYSKEMNLHSASPDEAGPIPFRAMSHYPYTSPERYPHSEDLEHFHTRVISKSIPTLVAPPQ